VPEQEWNDVLNGNGFSGIDFAFHDYDDDIRHEFSIMVSTAASEVASFKIPERIIIVVDPESSAQQHFAKKICMKIDKSLSSEVETVSLYETSAIRKSRSAFFFVFLPETETHFLYDLDQATYALLQNILTNMQKVLWITSDAINSDGYAKSQMIDGLARVLRNEVSTRTLITLELESEPLASDQRVNTIIKVLGAVADTRDEPGVGESEYIERNGTLLTSRAAEAGGIDEELHKTSYLQKEETPLHSVGSVTLINKTPGLLSTLCFILDEEYGHKLPPAYVEIKVQFHGLNFHDLPVALGRHPDTTFGCDCSGVVTRVGEDCDEFKPGNLVAVFKDRLFSDICQKLQGPCVQDSGCTTPPRSCWTWCGWGNCLSLAR
jgi:hypothetical protein